GQALPELVGGLPPEDASWRPPDGAWSILEIVLHLADEEVEDFRARLESTLDDPERTWPSIDPEGWAVHRNYNDGDLNEALACFVSRRSDSLVWLRSLHAPDWLRSYEHPAIGSIRAGDLLAAWASHDALHLRQIAKRLHQLAARDSGEHSAAYAGSW
ncbi:MAG: DinB family protein, partial [Planctomycetota bacterium]